MTCFPGDVIGELALLYDLARNSSVQARDESILWRLDKETFKAIVKPSSFQKIQRNDTFLETVPALGSVKSHDERRKIIDTLKTERLMEFHNINHFITKLKVAKACYKVSRSSPLRDTQSEKADDSADSLSNESDTCMARGY